MCLTKIWLNWQNMGAPYLPSPIDEALPEKLIPSELGDIVLPPPSRPSPLDEKFLEQLNASELENLVAKVFKDDIL